MVENIIALVSCLMCAVPFFIISIYNKDSREPISFWSGDTSLKGKVKNVREYNQEMAALYHKCALAFCITGLIFIFSMVFGTVLLCLECSVGILLVYRNYKRILNRYI